jgi:CheY-like chemotaxis protein
MPSAVTHTEVTPSVFIVDDEPDMRILARAYLQRGGFNVADEAEDGPQGLARFLDLNPPPVPSVVLLDNHMPGLTGLEVAEQMLSQHPTQMIVLFSAQIDDSIRERARGIGIAACVSKRDVSRLPEIIRALLQES